MAKGLRSSTRKANRVKLRSKVFGLVENARKERLSSKLLELASRPLPDAIQDTRMQDGYTDAEQQKKIEPEAAPVVPERDMEIDSTISAATSKTTSTLRGSGRVQKRRRGKARAAMVFPVYKKGKRIGPRKKQPK